MELKTVGDMVFKKRLHNLRVAEDFISKYCYFEGKPIKLKRAQRPMLAHLVLNQRTLDIRPKKVGKTFLASLFCACKLFRKEFKYSKIFAMSTAQEASNDIIKDINTIVDDSPKLKQFRALFPKDRARSIEMPPPYNSSVTALAPSMKNVNIRPTCLIVDEACELQDDLLYQKIFAGAVRGIASHDRYLEFHLITYAWKNEGVWWDIYKKGLLNRTPLFRWGDIKKHQKEAEFAIASHFKLNWIHDSKLIVSGDGCQIKFKKGKKTLKFTINHNIKNDEIDLKVVTNLGIKFNCIVRYEKDDLVVYFNPKNLFKYSVEEQDWTTTEYTKDDIDAFTGEIGEDMVQMLYYCKALDKSHFCISSQAVDRNLIDSPLFDERVPCVAGLDLGKKQTPAALVIIQPNEGKWSIPKVYEAPLGTKYNLLKEIIEQNFIKQFNITLLVVDSTSGEEFVDFSEDDFRDLGCHVHPMDFRSNRDVQIFNSVKFAVESKDDDNRGKLLIPRNEVKFINDLRGADPHRHMPDSLAALGMILRYMKKITPRTQSSSGMLFSERKQSIY